MESSILKSLKKSVNVSVDNEDFDDQLLMFINSTFATLRQLGVGPDVGFAIEDDTPTWDDYLEGDLTFNGVQSYMSAKVRLQFDAPSSSYHQESLKQIANEFEWRISVNREETQWVPATVV